MKKDSTNQPAVSTDANLVNALFTPEEAAHLEAMVNELNEFWTETEDSTLLSAFIYLTREMDSDRSARTMRIDMSDNAAVRYLMRRLDLTMKQVQILACMVFHLQCTNNSCDMDDLSRYMKQHPLKTLELRGEMQGLREKGYVMRTDDMLDSCSAWKVREAAMKAITENRAFDVTTLRAADSTAFLKECYSIIREGRRHDEDGQIESETRWLLDLNQNLPVAKNIRRLSGNDSQLTKLWVLFAACLASGDMAHIDPPAMEMVLRTMEVRRIVKALRAGTHPLMQSKLVEAFGASGLAQADKWTLTRKAWLELLENEDEMKAVMAEAEGDSKRLTSYEKIPERPLFFSGKTEEEVNRLRHILQDDQYHMIEQKLREKRMPTGLNILLYGTPGTGKTELVQQLARETGRDIFIVDMSQIRDKYVGESEKNLSEIFATYRHLVASKSKTPILFCNECDAIFGARMERTRDSVDKMENTLQNILLEEMEKMQGIMICTTNLTSSLDSAFERRFLVKLLLPKPCDTARKQIWTSMLPDLTDEQATLLATKYDFSGGQIQNVTRKQIINSIFTGSDELDFDRILADCNAETMDRNNGHNRIGF